MKKPDSKQQPVEKPEVLPGAEGRMHPDGALDDPIHEFWTEHGKSIISAAVLVVLATALIFGVRGYRSAQEQSVRAAYTEAIAEDDLTGFATQHTGHQLAGVAAMQVANRAYAQGDWEKAKEFYRIAVDSLARSQLSGRARLGLGITLTKAGDSEQSERILLALAEDEREMLASRAEAYYHLAILYYARNRMSDFERATEALSQIDHRSYWMEKLRFYQNHVSIPVDESIPLSEEDILDADSMETLSLPAEITEMESMDLPGLPPAE